MDHKSPFKFLDAYNKEDHAVFFGREEEIDRLYEMVHQRSITLVYGESGTGKSSLVQCGLANRFSSTEWFDIYIRRDDEINNALMKKLLSYCDQEQDVNSSLWEELQDIMGDQMSLVEGQPEAEADSPVIQCLRKIYNYHLKPVYLIFDQFEELFILGAEDEQQQFYQTISDILKGEPYCRIIIIIREETLAQLYDFEKVLPRLFDNRLRVEPMSRHKAAGVVQSSCEKFNIKFEDADANPVQIVEKISAGRSGVSLPYLQVYLDRLYREDMERTYGANPPDVPLPELEFTYDEIEALGKIGDVLKVFLQEQTRRVQAEFQVRFPTSSPAAVRSLLSGFVSLEGTKIPLKKAEISHIHLGEEELNYLLDMLQQSRILREEDGTYELAHDTLSQRIAEQRSVGEIAMLEAVELVKSRMRTFDRLKAWMNEHELRLIEDHEAQLRSEGKLTEDEWAFIRKNQGHNRRQRQLKRLAVGVVIVSLFVAVLALIAWSYNVYTDNARISTVATNLEQKNIQLNDESKRLQESLDDTRQQLGLVKEGLDKEKMAGLVDILEKLNSLQEKILHVLEQYGDPPSEIPSGFAEIISSNLQIRLYLFDEIEGHESYHLSGESSSVELVLKIADVLSEHPVFNLDIVAYKQGKGVYPIYLNYAMVRANEVLKYLSPALESKPDIEIKAVPESPENEESYKSRIDIVVSIPGK